MTSFEFSTGSPESVAMRSVYQSRVVIAQCCGHRKKMLSSEPPQGHCPQSVGGPFHVKRVALLAAGAVQKKPICLSGTHLSIQRDNLSFVTLLKHSPVYCGRSLGCVVYPSIGQWKNPETTVMATGSDRKGSWRI